MGVCLPRPIIDDDNNGGMKQTAEEDEKKTKTTESTINNRRCKPNERVPLGKLTKFGYSTDFLQKYEKGKLLGRGQFGCTYAATDVATGENVAVKMIEKKNMILPIAVEDVKREVKILKVLSGHENIVRFYDAFEDDDYVYIVMELCEGGELLDRILARLPYSLCTAISYIFPHM
ncbi:hypothetical protein KP509_24G011200 [Ceratopteris richardii]|uniref:Protein kinase domain-containing protein n=1 Tax=Ceratopteris richardii TaxID=49495 RepID=A0A8T2RV72_CERRI|nr:hypothetical protein KP509_24G011200 [Ceratopteris richardii]